MFIHKETPASSIVPSNGSARRFCPCCPCCCCSSAPPFSPAPTGGGGGGAGPTARGSFLYGASRHTGGGSSDSGDGDAGEGEASPCAPATWEPVMPLVLRLRPLPVVVLLGEAEGRPSAYLGWEVKTLCIVVVVFVSVRVDGSRR